MTPQETSMEELRKLCDRLNLPTQYDPITKLLTIDFSFESVEQNELVGATRKMIFDTHTKHCKETER